MPSTKDLANTFDLDEATVRTLAREGVLPAERVSGRWVFSDEAHDILEDLLENENGDDAPPLDLEGVDILMSDADQDDDDDSEDYDEEEGEGDAEGDDWDEENGWSEEDEDEDE